MSEETLYCTKNDCYLAGQKLAGVDYLIGPAQILTNRADFSVFHQNISGKFRLSSDQSPVLNQCCHGSAPFVVF